MYKWAFIRIISSDLRDAVTREGVIGLRVGWMMVSVPAQCHTSDICACLSRYSSTLPILHFMAQGWPVYVSTGLHYSECQPVDWSLDMESRPGAHESGK